VAHETRLSSVDLSGNLGTAIWRVAWPVMLGQVLHTTMTVVDMFWVGRLGAASVAAVALSGSVLSVLFSAGSIFSVGVLALAARAAGADSRAGVRESVRHGVWLAAAVSILPAVLGVLFAGTVLRWFGAEPAVVDAGRAYLAILLASLPGFFVGMTVYAGFQALGDTKTPMMVWLWANVANIVLDPLLIFGWLGLPRLGVAGAAIATVATQTAGLAVMFVIFRRRGLLTLGGRLRWATARAIFGIGGAAGLQGVTRPLTGMLLFGIVTGFGTEATAAFGIGLRLLALMYIYLGGLASAGQTLVGQSLGQGRPELAWRVGQRVSWLAFGIQGAALPFLFFLAPQLVRAFNSDPAVVHYGVDYLRVLAPLLVMVGLSTGWDSAMRGAGDTTPVMVAALVANWAVKIPAALLLARWLGLNGVWLGIGLSLVVETALLGGSYFRRGWLRKEVRWEAA